ncbi:MAG: cation transporter [Acidilobaceae archaeon]
MSLGTSMNIRILLVALIFIFLGGTVKLMGFILFSSKAVLVDGITCVAAFLSGLIVIITTRAALKPPDVDHHYGHWRIAYGGPLGILIIYSASLGVALASIGFPEPYSVDVRATYSAILGTLLYSIAILIARLDPIGGSTLAVFGWSEVLEGLVSAIAAYAGASYSYIIDYSGGILILGYLLVAILRESRDLIFKISDVAVEGIEERIREELESRKLKIISLRVRMLVPGRYAGDATVVAPCNLSLEAANIIVDEITDFLKRNNIDLTVHIDKDPKCS